MKLVELLTGIEYELMQGSDDVDVTQLTYDSRRATPGSAFVCIRGLQEDGHDYMEHAYHKGSRVFLVEDYDYEMHDGATVVQAKDLRAHLSRLAANFYHHPSGDLQLVGITGTNGKTSITSMIASVIDTLGLPVGTIGTLGTKINDDKLDIVSTTPTTPEALELQAIFAQMKEADVKHAIMEVSSMALHMHRVDHCQFDVAIFTNVTPEHLDDHGTMEHYIESKLKLFALAPFSLINADDPLSERVRAAATGECWTYGIEQEADLRATDLELLATGVQFTVNGHRFHVAIPGKFTVYNALATIGACLRLGFTYEEIARGLAGARGATGRLQLLNTNEPFQVFIDYAHTPDALQNVISAVREFTTGKVITVFGCGGDRDRSKRPVMGQIAGKLSDYTIVTSDNPRSEAPEQIIGQIEHGLKKSNGKYELVVDRRQAIARALQRAKYGDAIIIAGKGHETYQLIGNIVTPFDDAKEVRRLLAELRTV